MTSTTRIAVAFCAAVVLAGTRVAWPQTTPDRSHAPAAGPAAALTLPAIQKQALSNGLPVWIVEMHEVPLVDVSLVVKSGAAADPAGRFGVASYTAAMLDEGAGRMDALALADAIDVLGASLTTAASYDASTVRLHTLASNLAAALPIMADVVLRPTFPQPDVDRLRVERLTALRQMRDSASQLSTAAYNRMLYGPTHRYGTGVAGTEATTAAMTTEDLRAFHAAHYQPQNAHLLVVGDVTAAAVLPQLERAFGTWANTGTVPTAALPAAPRPTARHVYLLDKPGAAQSQIRIGTIGVARSTSDYHAIDVANTMLGGAASFSSRLMLNLREQHGYTYGVESQFSMRRTAGPFTALAGVQSDKTRDALIEFFNEFTRMAQPAPGDELMRVKNLRALSFPRAFETTADIADQLTSLVVYDLPESFVNEYVAKTQAVTAADVERVAREHILPDHFIVVVAGDLAIIEQPVRNAGLGPVTIVTADDVLR